MVRAWLRRVLLTKKEYPRRKTYKDDWYREKEYSFGLWYLYDADGKRASDTGYRLADVLFGRLVNSSYARAKFFMWLSILAYVCLVGFSIYSFSPVASVITAAGGIYWVALAIQLFVDTKREVTMARLRKVSTATVTTAATLASVAQAMQKVEEEFGVTITKEDMPILAHRKAYLIHKMGKGWTFKSATSAGYRTSFGRDADAECWKRSDYRWRKSDHKAPTLRCECGFYAVPADKIEHFEYNGISLQVELSGTVIEHELGYRAEHQRVISWEIPTCVGCCADATHALLFVTDEEKSHVIWTCRDHEVTQTLAGSMACLTVSIDQIAESLDVPYLKSGGNG